MKKYIGKCKLYADSILSGAEGVAHFVYSPELCEVDKVVENCYGELVLTTCGSLVDRFGPTVSESEKNCLLEAIRKLQCVDTRPWWEVDSFCINRVLKRVPLDFSYPIGEVWSGYRILSSLENSFAECHHKLYDCNNCKAFGKSIGLPFTDYGCPDMDVFRREVLQTYLPKLSPPVGEGYQLWETVTEGSPFSPVFATLEDLCRWCANNTTVYGNERMPYEDWLTWLSQQDRK